MSAARLGRSDRVRLLTGAGRGIWLGTVRELAAHGARGIVLVDLPGGELDAAAASLGDRALVIAADVTDTEPMADAVRGALEHVGGLDVVVANEGI
jgi:NAD(P)-dependent dehydrogenase (short-subunit alcohol dehydrogenase family)